MANEQTLTILSPEDLARLREIDATARAQQGRLPVPPAGQSAPVTRYDALPFANASGLEIPAGGLIYLQVAMDAGKVYYQAARPHRAAMLSVGIAAAIVSAAAGSPGRAFIDGVPLVLMTAAGWIAATLQSRLGSQPDSFEAVLNDDGPMQIVAKAATPFVHAIFLRRRRESVNVENHDSSVQGSFEHLHFSDEFVLSQADYGKAHVEVRP